MKPGESLSIGKNIAWNTVGNLSFLIAQWLFSFIVVKVLGFEQAGIFSLAVSIATIFFVISSYTMRNYQNADVLRKYSDSSYVDSRIVTCAISFILCYIFCMFNKYSISVTSCIMAYMLFKTMEAMSDVYQGIFQRKMRLDYAGKSLVAKGLLSTFFFSLVLFMTKDLFVSILSISALCAFVVFLYERKNAHRVSGDTGKKLSVHSRIVQVGKLLWVCFPLLVYGFLFSGAGQIPKYYIELLLGAQALGFYSSVGMPVLIVQVSASFLFSPLVTPLAESLARGRRAEFLGLVKKVMLLLFLLAIIAFLLALMFGNPVLLLLFGNEIIPYVYLLMPLVGCTIVTALAWFLVSLMTIMDKLKHLILSSAISFLIVLVLCPWAITIGGMNGATYLLLAALGVFCIICISVLVISYKKSERRAS